MSSSVYRRLHGLFTTNVASKTAKSPFKSPKPASKSVKPAAKTAKPISETAKPSSDTVKAASKTSKPTTSEVQKRELIVKKFKEDSNSDRFRLRIPYYAFTVRRLAEAKQFALIEEIIEHQKTFKDITDERFAVRLISLYGKAGMFEHAHKLFDEMPQLNCPRTVLSFNAILNACVNSKKFDKLGELFLEVPKKLSIEPNIVSYNTLVKSFCQMGSLDSASQIIEHIENNGLHPNLITFNTLLDAYYRNNRLSDAEKLWALMENKNVVPDVRSYNAKMRALVADKRMSRGLELIEEMKTKGVKPDIYCFNVVIKGFCDDGNLEEAKRWYGEIEKSDLVPDKVTLEIILKFVCDMADFDYALELCKEAINSKLSVRRTIQYAVGTMVKEKNIAKAQELVDFGKSKTYFKYRLKITVE